jgi:SAM-dependent methyltransferase
MEIERLVRRARAELDEHGLMVTLRKGVSKLRDFAEYPIVKQTRKSATFSVAGRSYGYLTHHYNATWRNERAVELPLADEFLGELAPGARLLEVGNVLAYYRPSSHTVVDKFEPTAGVINQDIMEFGEPKSFDAILSISTLEHVGWDEKPRDEGRAERALGHMRSLLAPGGRLFLSFPIGYNLALDAAAFEGRLGFRRTHYLKRVSADNRWQEVPASAARGVGYGTPYPCANALFVGID